MAYMAWIHTVSGWNGRHARLRGVWRRANDRCGGTGWAQFKQVAAGIVEAPAIIKKAVVSPEHRLPLSLYVGLLHQSERRLSDTFMNVARHHQQQPDVYQVCTMMAGWSKRHIELFQPIIDRYGEKTKHEPERLRSALFEGPRSGGVGVLRRRGDLLSAGGRGRAGSRPG